jgi:triosephosphate isomerase
MTKKLIIANWKLNPLTLAEAVTLAGKIDPNPRHEAVLCPPAMFLSSLKYPVLGAQDCFWENKGPYTGQISPLALKHMGVKYCIVGHSERRSVGERDEDIQKKIEALLSVKITPVLCVGYGTTVDLDDMEVTDIVKKQIKAVATKDEMSKIVVAYEPVWAISAGNPYLTKKIATPEHAEKIAIYIKVKLGAKKVLYGGSTNSVNCKKFLSEPHIEGLLVGGASLLPQDFNAMINSDV